jgi:hypothetical protein
MQVSFVNAAPGLVKTSFKIAVRTEANFLVQDQSHSKLVAFSYLMRELFSRNIWSHPN